jgi:superfamily II DNA or RNA helicase
MKRCGVRLVAGVYVAQHAWADAHNAVKIGHSQALEKRLGHTSFITCYPVGWHFHTVFECPLKDAAKLELATLVVLREVRLGDRELVRLPPEAAVQTVAAVAKALKIAVVQRSPPPYGDSRCDQPSLANEADNAKKPVKMTKEGKEAMLSKKMMLQLTHLRRQLRNIISRSAEKGTGVNPSPSPTLDSSGPQRVANEDDDVFIDELEFDDASSAQSKADLEDALDLTISSGKTFGNSAFGLLRPENKPVALRPYQLEAVRQCVAELRLNGRCILQMACRCGKTPVAHEIIRLYLKNDMERQGADNNRGRGKVIVYLMPGLALLRQTAMKIAGYGLPSGCELLLLGSDPRTVRTAAQQRGGACNMTTDPAVVERYLSRCRQSGHPLIILSTYNSSGLVAGIPHVGLTVFDEAHRVCGSVEPSCFNKILYSPPTGHRLFMTATPTFDTPISMDNRALFGGVAYRYYLRTGINNKYVNNFAVRIVLADAHKARQMEQRRSGGPKGKDVKQGRKRSLRRSYPLFSEQILQAMAHVDKLIVFCGSIDHANRVAEALTAASGPNRRPSNIRSFKVLCAHSGMGPGAAGSVLRAFSIPGERFVLVNVRLFQEGVEVPDLNGVFFAAPRYSPRDIIQSICRPLNIMKHKPTSTIFIPAAFEKNFRPDHPVNLGHFSTLVPFTDALMDEDPALFEYLIDPHKKPYDIDVLGLRTMRLSTEQAQKVFLPAIRRGVRYSSQQRDRLHRAERLPWKQAFAEMKRIVLECNRYPKMNDAWVVGSTPIKIHMFYSYARRGYNLYQRHLAAGGSPIPASDANSSSKRILRHVKVQGDSETEASGTYLQPYQIFDLESLPAWKTYGANGPYYWKQSLDTLRRLLRRHKGVLPPMEIHRGGYIGLDATLTERLAGALCNINQQDKHDCLAVDVSKQRDLDAVCKEFKLPTWRKQRDKRGFLVEGAKSWITESYDRFKQLYANPTPQFLRYVDEHFPGYPEKHSRMESLEVQAKGTAPPRGKFRSDARVSKVARTEGTDAADVKRHVTVCRVCRVEVLPEKWLRHVASAAHRRALGQNMKKLRHKSRR